MLQQKRKSICIITFSPVARDVRVLRQIEYLSRHYDVTAIGEGGEHPSWQKLGEFKWVPTLTFDPAMTLPRAIEKAAGFLMLLAGRLHPSIFYRWYWRQPIMQDALAKAVATGADAFHANDWNALPLAVEAAKKLHARAVFDAHEYGPLEFANRLQWRIAYSEMIRQMLRRYAPQADAWVTVAPAIAERYRRELGIDPVVVMNAPATAIVAGGTDPVNADDIRLIYHGGAIPDRGLETMIETLALSQPRFTLHLMLTGNYTGYIRQLRGLAEKAAPGRVTFHDPVPPEEVVSRIARYHIGFCFVAPTNYNNLVCLPNKFFDFIAAGLPVCIGPSPSMAEIAEAYGFGCVAPTFAPRDIATVLNGLTADRLGQMKMAARKAASEINADREMGKLIEIYERMLK